MHGLHPFIASLGLGIVGIVMFSNRPKTAVSSGDDTFFCGPDVNLKALEPVQVDAQQAPPQRWFPAP